LHFRRRDRAQALKHQGFIRAEHGRHRTAGKRTLSLSAVKTVIRSVEVSQAAVGRYLPRRLKILDLA
jgi:hypothetical protein